MNSKLNVKGCRLPAGENDAGKFEAFNLQPPTFNP
jgi:hypothetical protein